MEEGPTEVPSLFMISVVVFHFSREGDKGEGRTRDQGETASEDLRFEHIH